MQAVKSLSVVAIGLILGVGGLSAQAQTESIVYQTTLPDYEGSYFYESGFPGGDFDRFLITGLPKFDPSLGTLVDVIVSVEYALEVETYLESQGILNTSVTHTAGFGLFQFAVGLTFTSTALDPPTVNLVGDVDSSFGVGCVGNPGDGDACSTGFGTFYGGFVSTFSVANNILLEDFVGTGDYEGFTFEVDFIEPSFDLFNVDFAFADIIAFQDSSSTFISLEYVYSTGVADADGDGIEDAADNCINASNADQIDADNDGYGNACDADVNNDCAINAVDLGVLRVGFFGSDPQLDFNSDGVVNISDLGIMRASFFGVPGPSGIGGICDTARNADAPAFLARDAKTGIYQ